MTEGGGGLTITEFLIHGHEECTGEWREEKVGKTRVYRCPRCNAAARENNDTRRAYWQQWDARKLRREAGRRSSVRAILTAGKKADMLFQVGLALGELLDVPHRDHETFQMIRDEYDALRGDTDD